MEALHALIQRHAAEKIQNQTSLAFYNRNQMESNPRSELTEQISEIKDYQDGNTREYKNLLANR